MPRPKKTEKSKKEEIVLDLRQDREEFLRAFEKPTQIYRFLRARHIISPTYLHRSLFYLKNRCSRTNARREAFRVDDMLKVCEHKNASYGFTTPRYFDQLKIAILGFYIDPGVHYANSLSKKLNTVDAEISIQKTLRCRRKDCEIVHTEEVVGAVEVPVNPRNPDNYEEEPIIISTTDIKQSKDGQSIKNYSLMFRVYEPQDDSSESEDESSDNLQSDEEMDVDEDDEQKNKKLKDDPAAISLRNLTMGSRRKRVFRQESKECESDDSRSCKNETRAPRKFKKFNNQRFESAIYDADLSVFTSEKKSLLLDGEYELSLNRKCPESNDGRRNATWEALDGGREIKVLSTMNHCPILKFKLLWMEDDKPGPLAPPPDEDKAASFGEEPDSKRARRRINQKCNDTEKASENGNCTAENGPVLPVDSIQYRKLWPPCDTERSENGQLEANSIYDPRQIVYYQFIYNTESQQQTEARDDLYCPWCQLNCMSLYGLIKHLKTCHPRFNFSYTPQSQGSSVEVSVNECYDGSFCGNPQFIFAQPGMAFSRRGPVRRVQATDTLVYRPRKERGARNLNLNELLEKEENDSSPTSHYSAGHHRLYFHSNSSLPIRPCEFDNDSEEETDPDWLRNHIKKMLDEFTDVNDGEKPIMKLWNLYIMKHRCIADGQMSNSCQHFIDLYASLIIRHNLRRNLLLHLVTLLDFGVLKASALLSLIKHFDKIAEKTSKVTSKDEITNGSDILSEDIRSNDLSMEDVDDVSLPSVSKQSRSRSRTVSICSEKSTNLQKLQEIIDQATKTKKDTK
ncbi:unnamed protein product [Clavelina lepadiformis]|uniref:Polycomb protein VEFS-Box domain-containing protein n=1 Tax=Clavelina lepadiformis TaxID=159417 RepID=A0ABP0G8W8_CLALP